MFFVLNYINILTKNLKTQVSLSEMDKETKDWNFIRKSGNGKFWIGLKIILESIYPSTKL